MATVTVEIPDSLMSKLQRKGHVVQDIVLEALEQYIEAEDMAFSLPQTRTWQLCGGLEVIELEAEYVVGQDEQGKAVTDYAEHVNDLVY